MHSVIDLVSPSDQTRPESSANQNSREHPSCKRTKIVANIHLVSEQKLHLVIVANPGLTLIVKLIIIIIIIIVILIIYGLPLLPPSSQLNLHSGL